MTTVRITLPDQLAKEAQQAGLLSEGTVEKLLREELRARREEAFFAAIERMASTSEPGALSPEEVAREIAAMREERRAKTAR